MCEKSEQNSRLSALIQDCEDWKARTLKAEADLKTANTEVGRLNIQLRTRALKAEATLREARPYVADAAGGEVPEAQTISGGLLAEIDAILARSALPQDEPALCDTKPGEHPEFPDDGPLK